MSEFKVFKSGDFTVMSNYHLKDKELSLKAIGLMSNLTPTRLQRQARQVRRTLRHHQHRTGPPPV